MSSSRIRPDDVFPARDLPGRAEQWGRSVENRVISLEKNAVAMGQSVHGANRDSAAQLAALSEQVRRLPVTRTARADNIGRDIYPDDHFPAAGLPISPKMAPGANAVSVFVSANTLTTTGTSGIEGYLEFQVYDPDSREGIGDTLYYETSQTAFSGPMSGGGLNFSTSWAFTYEFPGGAPAPPNLEVSVNLLLKTLGGTFYTNTQMSGIVTSWTNPLGWSAPGLETFDPEEE